MTNNPASASLAVVLALLLTGCQHIVIPEPDRLQPWSKQLQLEQPDDSFAAVHARAGQRLVFIGAKHSNQTDSQAFRLIDQAFDALHIDTLIVEGPRYSEGPDSDRLLNWVSKQKEIDGFVQAGEIVPVVRGALAEGATVFGGEPDDAQIRKSLLARGFSDDDILGFYTLRSIPQWIRERKIHDAADERVHALIDTDLERNRQRLSLPGTVLHDSAAWEQWYTRTNNQAFGGAFNSEEAGPLANGKHKSQQIAAAISRARAEFLQDIIARHWNAGENVMIVFGRSHLMIHRDALAAMFGAACYVGDDIASAPADCHSS